jgi:lysozyme family protein
MKENWDKALNFVLAHEGGLVDDKNDPGGLTNFGICQRSYPELDIRNLTKFEAGQIYRSDYWDKIGGDDLVWPLDICVFDTAVNCGRGRAILFQNNTLNWQDYLIRRIAHYNSLPTAGLYLHGWLNRTLDLWKLIKSLPLPK